MFNCMEGDGRFHRENRTVDIVRRLGVITPKNIKLKRHPMDKPVSIFNPSFIFREDNIVIYARTILGYFTYASVISEVSVPIGNIKDISKREYLAEIKIFPDNRYDVWGVEDPRICEIDGKIFMTYCGRTVNYFNQSVWVERTLPVTAIHNSGWKKICVYRLPKELRGFVISDKDAFLVKTKKGYKLFHRLHMKDNNFYLVISDIDDDIEHNNLREIEVRNTSLALKPADFEEKIGWSTPPVKVGKYLILLLHGVDKDMKRYRIFAIAMDEKLRIKAVTPYYIMEPKEIYEIYGDRPYAIFPCGAQKIDDKILISYGAADSVLAFGEIEIDELLSMLNL